MNGHRVSFLCVLASALVAFTLPVNAGGNSPRSLSEEIRRIRSTIISAEVWLVPPRMESRFEINESNLPSVACSYHANAEKDVDSLVDVLVASRIVQQDDAEEPLPVGIAVYLRTSSGDSLTLVTTPEYANAPASGLFNRTVPVVAKRGFEEAMWKWTCERTSTRDVGLCRKQHQF